MTVDLSQTPDPPRRRTWSFYFVLAFLVLPLWSFVPLCWLFLLHSLATQSFRSYSWFGKFAVSFAASEALFSLYHAYLHWKISGPSPWRPLNPTELQIALKRVLKAGLASLPVDGYDEETLSTERPGSPEEDIIQLEYDDHRAIDFRNTLRTWFGRVPWSSVSLHEVRLWIYWSIYNADLPPLHEIPLSHHTVIEDAIDLLEKRLGCKIPEGSSGGKISPLRLTIDKVNVLGRPLAYYIVVGSVNRVLRFYLERRWNLTYASHDHLEYLLRIPPDWAQEKGPRPLVLFHGLGLGLLQYFTLIVHLLQAFPDRPLLIPLQPHISQDFFHPRYLRPMPRYDTTKRLATLIQSLGWADIEAQVCDYEKPVAEKPAPQQRRAGVTFLSHSNGSYAHAWMLKEYPGMIARSCFVDPVTFCSWEGDVCYNFIYRQCTTGIELLMRYFVGTELGVANLLQRHFDWSSNSLWYEEIPNARDPVKTFFVLGGKDDIIRADRVKKYLTSHGVREGLWFEPHARHGQALISGASGHKKIMDWLNHPTDYHHH